MHGLAQQDSPSSTFRGTFFSGLTTLIELFPFYQTYRQASETARLMLAYCSKALNMSCKELDVCQSPDKSDSQNSNIPKLFPSICLEPLMCFHIFAAAVVIRVTSSQLLLGAPLTAQCNSVQPSKSFCIC